MLGREEGTNYRLIIKTFLHIFVHEDNDSMQIFGTL